MQKHVFSSHGLDCGGTRIRDQVHGDILLPEKFMANFKGLGMSSNWLPHNTLSPVQLIRDLSIQSVPSMLCSKS